MATQYSIIDALKDMGRGDLKLVTKEIQQARLNFCLGCDSYGVVLHQCRECHCLMDGATWLAKYTCPKNKW